MTGLYVLLGGLLLVVSIIGVVDLIGRRRDQSQHPPTR